MKTLRIRTFVRRLHLWLGMSLGLLFVVLGLSGAALVFYIEIDEAINPLPVTHAAMPAPGWDSAEWDRALATAREHFPGPGGDWSFEVTGKSGPIPARYYPAQHHHGHHAEREMVWFSADGTRLLRSEAWGEYPMSWIYELHMHLLAGETGRQIVGWGGFALLLLLVSGIITWWPRGSLQKALALKRDAVALRRLRDLHKLSGLWSFPLLVLLALTGALLALPEVKEQIFTATVARPDQVPDPQSSQSSGTPVSLRLALANARRALPDARLAFIDVPEGGSAPVRLRVQVPGDPHRRFPGSFIFVDQYTGRVLAVHDLRRGNAAAQTSKWIRPLHDGSIGGLWGRILAVLAGLLPAALFGTGLCHWLRRRSARRHASSISNRRKS